MRAARLQTEGLIGVAADTARATTAIEQELRALRAELAQATGALSAELAAAVVAQQAELEEVRAELAEAKAAAARHHERSIHAIRLARDDDARSRAALWALRSTAAYEIPFEEPEPLVTIVVTTYMNWPLLRDRCLPSLLAQRYERWEAIVVGDAAPDDTRRVVESFGDARLRFVNLPYRGPYPDEPRDSWHVSGTMPWNTGLELAQGSWIATNSDDDALRPDHLESLLAHGREARAEVPYGWFDVHYPDGPRQKLGSFPPVMGTWGTQTSLLHRGLRFLPMQPGDWVFDVANDVSLLERMLRIGVRFSFLDQPVVDYYPSRLWSEEEQRLIRRESF